MDRVRIKKEVMATSKHDQRRESNPRPLDLGCHTNLAAMLKDKNLFSDIL